MRYRSRVAILLLVAVSLVMVLLRAGTSKSTESRVTRYQPIIVRLEEDYRSSFHRYNTTVDLRIIVLTYWNRSKSLRKCLASVSKLLTDHHRVALEIWIDRSVDGVIDPDTLNVASSFRWKQGPVTVWMHGKHVGLVGQWIYTWRPVSGNGTVTSELALYVEDDVDVSPYAFRYIRALNRSYASYEKVASYTLQNGTTIMRKKETKKPKDDTVYMHTLPGTWGLIPLPHRWVEFQDWFQQKNSTPGFLPYVQRAVDQNERYKRLAREGKEDTYWSIWFLRFMEEKNLVAIFSNLKTFTGRQNCSLSFHRGEEEWLHNDKLVTKKKHANPDLLDHWKQSYGRCPKSPKIYSHEGKVIKWKDLKGS